MRCKGIKNIPGIKSAKRRVLITKIKNQKGEIITSRKGIANVFGEFYKKLYDDNEQEETEEEIGENENESSIHVHSSNTNVTARVPEITTEELQTAINKLRKRQIPRQQRNQSRRHQSMRRQNEFTPEAWKRVKIKVIFKKGDVEDVGNYRPICSLPALHKLFTTILYSRLCPRLDQISGGIQKLIPNNRSSCDVRAD